MMMIVIVIILDDDDSDEEKMPKQIDLNDLQENIQLELL